MLKSRQNVNTDNECITTFLQPFHLCTVNVVLLTEPDQDPHDHVPACPPVVPAWLPTAGSPFPGLGSGNQCQHLRTPHTAARGTCRKTGNGWRRIKSELYTIAYAALHHEYAYLSGFVVDLGRQLSCWSQYQSQWVLLTTTSIPRLRR